MMDVLAQQAAPASPPAQPLITLDTLFWASVMVIFLLTIFSALLRRLAKDKALKLLHDYHVSFFSDRRQTMWGDLLVFSQGIELLFDHPFLTRRKVLKSSALIYDDELGGMMCLTRTEHGLHAHEKQDRRRQIELTFNPSWHRRMKRAFRNLLNVLRDAINKTVGLVIGRMTKSDPTGAALSSQAGDINSLTGSVINLAANAYEPLLERYIGREVVLEITLPPPPGPPPPPEWIPPTVDFSGYLVDYTARFIAVFNVDHTAIEEVSIPLAPPGSGVTPPPTVNGLKIDITPDSTIISCNGRDAFVLKSMCCGEDQPSELGVAMIPGTILTLGPITGPTRLTVERTRLLDIVVPRSRARVRYGSIQRGPHDRDGGGEKWFGIAPIMESREFLNTIRNRVGGLGAGMHDVMPEFRKDDEE